jgi:uncharacterized protein YggE
MQPIRVAVIGTLLVALAAPAWAQECLLPPGRHLRTSATIVIAQPPDRVSFTVGVETRAADAAEAFRVSAARMETVLAALKSRGVQPGEMQTSMLNLASYEEMTSGTLTRGFRAWSRLTVGRDDPKAAGDLLQAAIAAGANDAGGLRFSVKDPTAVQRRGLQLAFEAARIKGEALAGFAHQSLGRPLCVYERADGERFGAGIASSGSVPLEIGLEPVSFTVGVVFELK